MPPEPAYCQTCSSELRPGQERYSPPCCGVPICGACTARNPRLKAYTPCLRCGDVRTRAGAAEVARGAAAREEERRRGEDVFVLEDSDEEGAGEEGAAPTAEQQVPPPPPEARPPPTPEPQVVEIKHLIARGDTLHSIARRYAADPHDLLALNNLPHAALYTNPAILRTRTELVIRRSTIGARSALDAYFSDEEWERGATAPARGKVHRWTVVGAALPPGAAKV
ncbi:hypothetical protein Q8F55_003430 [Vanrija albida]|uniref:LysM domain-containing protein n=1 Tax=Vanrija albida TaxID=181172 RepID=A0ABR3Q4R6_9TREE